MNAAQSGLKAHERTLPELDALFAHPRVRALWTGIVSLDPLGMYATRPTIAATRAKMTIPELQASLAAEADGRIVDADGQVNVIKMAVDPVWNLPALARLLGHEERAMRATLAAYTGQGDAADGARRAYLPPLGGTTLYFFGDPSKLADAATEVAVRCHDACCGSDCFGTDICTCRPYLVYAMQGCVETAKRGGVGVIAYFRKEGRALGEVIKFRVYNTRKAQPGGDTPENYFKVTESIAGIRDARVQELMPDVLLLCGISRIDWLLSMSADKYEAIVGAGVEVAQRVPLPSSYVPAGATVEITAKIASGYHTASIQPDAVADDLRSLESVRLRCGRVYELALRGKSRHFDLDLARLPAVVDLVADMTRRTYGNSPAAIPYHSRWRHMAAAEVAALARGWPVDAVERARRLVDLVTVSALLDAGAGASWSYLDADARRSSRSEGLAAAALDMFRDGAFSSDPALPHRVNSHGLRALELRTLQKGFQVGKHNAMVGLEGRHGLLQRLGAALDAQPAFFGAECPRPGNLVDYILAARAPPPAGASGGAGGTGGTVSIRVLWRAVIEGLESIWPATHASARRGDVWAYTPLKVIGTALSDMVPLHKLSQWLAYSLLEPLEELGIVFTDMHLLTGLAEYRNGGLFVDAGVLTPKARDAELIAARVEYDVGTELVVEWRALTVILLDKTAEALRARIGATADELPLAKVLQVRGPGCAAAGGAGWRSARRAPTQPLPPSPAIPPRMQGGTWAAGRELAKTRRPDGSSPIPLRTDGTVF